MDVLPWEYPETHPTSPPVYQPSGYPPPPHPQFQSSTSSIQPPNPSQKSIPEPKAHNQTSISLPAASSIHYNPVKTLPSSKPKRHSSISSPPPYHPSNPSLQPLTHPQPDPHPPQPTSPPSSSISHSQIQQTLTHNLSTESFDSVAPPPIRTTPRAGSRRVSVERRMGQYNGGYENGREKGRGKGP
ncbi:MAG: hypothetical protein Q9180_009595 [Flavoplaca navasiana]